MNNEREYQLTSQEMWADPQIEQVVSEWIKAQSHPDYRLRIRNIIRALPFLHFVALICAVLICLYLDGAKVSHLGAAVIAFSTAITGICVIYVSRWNSRVIALNYAHTAMHPKRLYDRFKATPDDPHRRERIGMEWFQYYAKKNYDEFIRDVVVWELLLATLGTTLWGFADLFETTNVDLRSFVCHFGL